MSPPTNFARYVALVLATFLIIPAVAGAATTKAKLRVLTPTKVLDPGTTYYVDGSISVPTSPEADCLGPPGGSGAAYTYDSPTALGLLASAGRATKRVSPLSLTDQFGFGLAICGIGGVEAGPGEFWYLKSNHEEATLGADQLTLASGDEVLFYLAPDNFPAPNPAELELEAPPSASAGDQVTVRVSRHACVTDQTTFEVTCSESAAEGATVIGGAADATTGADGTAKVKVDGATDLFAVNATDIPSQALAVCVPDPDPCPPKRGERIVGSSLADKIEATRGFDRIRARGGDDLVDIRKGGGDTVNCGPGDDTVRGPKHDEAKISRNCETVRGLKGSKR